MAATWDSGQLNRDQGLSCSMMGLQPAGPQENKVMLPSLAALHMQNACQALRQPPAFLARELCAGYQGISSG